VRIVPLVKLAVWCWLPSQIVGNCTPRESGDSDF